MCIILCRFVQGTWVSVDFGILVVGVGGVVLEPIPSDTERQF